MQIIPVTNKAASKDFLLVNALMNRSNPAYIQPLDNEVNAVFDPQTNKAFHHGEAMRWILKILKVN